ncbi:MAG: tetratricopeptide repeat protein [Lentisphaerae bacterium]|nr:tetratricopeptide repeat protein [Lentisphaerota bacterium]
MRMRALDSLCVCLLASVLLGGCAHTPKATERAEKGLEEAVIEQDWQRVVELCSADPQKAKTPVYMCLKGHACLALNRNDESVEAFMSVAETPGAAGWWRSWTKAFAKQHPENLVAVYLEADGVARTGDWEAAIKRYDSALALDKDFALALNARGTVHALTGKPDDALSDLKQATESSTELADAHASLGTLYLMKKATGALETYEEGLTKSASFALARLGRGCARLAQSTDPSNIVASATDFLSVTNMPCLQSAMRQTLHGVQSLIDAAMHDTEGGSESAGMSVRTTRELYSGMSRTERLDAMRGKSVAELRSEYADFARTDFFRGVSLWSKGGDPSTRLDLEIGAAKGLVYVKPGMETRVDYADTRAGILMERELDLAPMADIRTILAERGVGGISTDGLQITCPGTWAVRNTRFGLFPDQELPLDEEQVPLNSE